MQTLIRRRVLLGPHCLLRIVRFLGHFNGQCRNTQRFSDNLSKYSWIKCKQCRPWSGAAKVSYILRHRGVQLRFAYSWERPAILVASKGKSFYIFCFFTFIHFPLSPLTLSFISSTISSICLLSFSGRRKKKKKMTRKCWRVVEPQTTQTERGVWSGSTLFD